jgi:hypothetical protein
MRTGSVSHPFFVGILNCPSTGFFVHQTEKSVHFSECRKKNGRKEYLHEPWRLPWTPVALILIVVYGWKQ